MQKAIEYIDEGFMLRLVEAEIELENDDGSIETAVGMRLEVGQEEEERQIFTFSLEELESFVLDLDEFKEYLVARQKEDDQRKLTDAEAEEPVE